MNCQACDGRGLWPFVDLENRTPDGRVTVADLYFAVCLCDVGQTYRRAENEGKQTMPLWRVWCAREQIDPARVFMLEDVWTSQEMAAAGFRQAPTAVSREAALLARGKRAK